MMSSISCLFNICIFLILRQTSKSIYYYSLVYDSLKVLHFIYLIVYVHAHECVYACWGMCVSLSQHMCEGQRTISRSQFSPSTMWVLGFKLRPSGLAKGSFTYRAISPVLRYKFLETSHWSSLLEIILPEPKHCPQCCETKWCPSGQTAQ